MERYQYPAPELKMIEGLQTPLAVYQFLNKRVVTVALSDGFLRVFGYTERAQAIHDMDHNMYAAAHPDDVNRIANASVRFAEDGSEYDVVYRTRTKKSPDAYRVVHARGEIIFTEDGTRLQQVWYMDEGPYVEKAEGDSPAIRVNLAMGSALHEESILRGNRYDFLTGLPSLAYFFELAEAGKASLHRAGKEVVLVYMDLNGMKYYNHRKGFAEGDLLLKAFAQVIAGVFSNENCCHIGADRFAAFTAEEGLEAKLKEVFEKADRMNGGQTLPVRAGIYSAGMEDVPASTAYDRAKMACDEVVKTDTSAFKYYNAELRDSARRRRYIITSIDQAIREKWIKVYYQPIVRAVNQKICDEEALARWIDPTEGFLSPAEFIPYLEQGGLIYRLDLYVVEQVLEKIRTQEEAGIPVLPQSVNLSRADFDACDIVEEIRQRVDAAGVSRDRITIEITESTIGSDFDFMKEQVGRFRELGFPVWMDDFGSGYSSLDVLQSIRFDLIKFDMSFMRRLDEGENARIILTDLMRMATSLGVDTVCEGVETEEQVRFLQEIGCSKLQGFYFCKPVPWEVIRERYQTGLKYGIEDPETAGYYETIGRINLYDLGVIAGEEKNSFQHAFNTVPMGIIEIRGEEARFLRSNPSYREFMRRAFGVDMPGMASDYRKFTAAFMKNISRACSEQNSRIFYDDRLPDGSVIHSFTRRIGVNPANGSVAVAVAVLSVTDPDDGATYAEIARALAADYYNMYVVDLDTEEFIEYTSPAGKDEMAEERQGSGFFAAAREEVFRRVYPEDRQPFLARFTRENVIRELDESGVFTSTYRVTDSGEPLYVNMKVSRLHGGNRIILGVSVVDAQMRQQEAVQAIVKERNALARVMAIAEDYISIYSVNPETGEYIEYSSSEEYQSLGLLKEGEDIFRDGMAMAERVIFSEDLPTYRERFTRETILRDIRETGVFKMHYRLMFHGEPTQVTLKAVLIHDGEHERLLAGVRAWQKRMNETGDGQA